MSDWTNSLPAQRENLGSHKLNTRMQTQREWYYSNWQGQTLERLSHDSFTAGNQDNIQSSLNAWFRKLYKYMVARNRKSRAYIGSWQKSVTAAALAVGVVFVINLSYTIALLAKTKTDDGVGLIYEGDCAVVNRWNTTIHLIINILGTLLLGISNYTMQCLSSPTRNEVDAAHAKGVSLDIGVLSVRNLRHVHPRKCLLWICLCVSSMPLHFLWNSTVFTLGTSSTFSYLVVDQSFLSGALYQEPHYVRSNMTEEYCDDYDVNVSSLPVFMLEQYRAGEYDKISAEDCFNRYSYGDVGKFRNLIVITQPNTTMNMSVCAYNSQKWNGSSILAINWDLNMGSDWIQARFGYDDFPYRLPIMSPDGTFKYPESWPVWDITQDLKANGTWHMGPYRVLSCWSERFSGQCQLQYASSILYIVLICNLIKLVCLITTVVCMDDVKNPVLVTVGDGASSFLDNSDEVTESLCLVDHLSYKPQKQLALSRDDTENRLNISWRHRLPQHQHLSFYNRKPTRRLSSVETATRKVIIFLSSFTICFGVGIPAMVMTSQKTKVSAKLGGTSSEAYFNFNGDSGSDLFVSILIANSPQVIFSILYVIQNASLTIRFGALEWASYAKPQLTPLRVSCPSGDQKWTYFLHLPWKYEIPLIIAQMLMHFLISRSLFLARARNLDTFGVYMGNETPAIGYSSSGVMASLITSAAIATGVFSTSFIRLNNRIPTHGNKSIVISALCHAEFSNGNTDDNNASERLSTKPLMWGVTRKPRTPDHVWEHPWGLIDPVPGHCTFSDEPVELPQQGLCYT